MGWSPPIINTKIWQKKENKILFIVGRGEGLYISKCKNFVYVQMWDVDMHYKSNI